MNDLRKSRHRNIIEFGRYCNELLEHKGEYPEKMKRRLEGFKKKLKEASHDALLKDIIRMYLLVLSEMEKLLEARNAGDTVGELRHNLNVHRLWNKGDEIVNRLAEGRI